ncbi:MAG TPA: 3-oxoacyl-[acyl-carrier-protein] synthase III C-terminal domain-containing protein [Blastocatellia bacterium]|jgi:3-oxoacyl-[acyl-carrier-protein] synthase-3|nr:3-oxoacyl-[acyl-carrier-protein] synthase III C-terminal domain-containing protein [Blastocatellia bacterium]
MKDVYIDHLSFSLGDETRTVEDSAARGRLVSSARVLKEAGFSSHHICSEKRSAYDLARSAVEKIEGDLRGIGAILYSTCLPVNGNAGDEKLFYETRDVKHLMDFPASHLQSDFKLDAATVIGLNQQACTGMLGSLRVARMLLNTEPELGRVLCVTADRFPDAALYEQSYSLISDGAAACIASFAPSGFRLLGHHAATNGAMAGASDDEAVGNYFSYTFKVIRDALIKAGLGIDDIDWIVPQNTNAKAWQILSRLLGFDFGRVYFPSIGDVGHVISGDNIINLSRLIADGKIKPGERALLFMAGYGLNWQCVILEKV